MPIYAWQIADLYAKLPAMDAQQGNELKALMPIAASRKESAMDLSINDRKIKDRINLFRLIQNLNIVTMLCLMNT